MNISPFKFIWLGQCIMRYTVPYVPFHTINSVYEKEFSQLPPANKQLVGKIKNEHSLFYDGVDTSKMHRHRLLPIDVLNWFDITFKHYLKYIHIRFKSLHLNSIWINEMNVHEYNPIHVHQGTIFTGLSSVMILKLPDDPGPEFSSASTPMNGKLQIVGAAAGQFAKTDYTPIVEERDFFVFPYDMRHVVYPMTHPQAKRRTLACNVDVEYNPIESRSAQ